jgi:hypothetical protein
MSPARKRRQAKRVQPAKTIERQGVALIAKIVADMGHLWNEPQNDFGTDGYIELVDPELNRASSRIVLVQSKATSVAFGDRPIGFTCEEDDLRYWLNGNAPVILVRSHPSSGEAYWTSIKDYFKAHPDQRESRRILFDRKADRFDSSCSGALWDLARPRLDGLHLGTPPVHESLVSNLLPVESFPDMIYVADASIRKQSEARDAFAGAAGRWPRAWILWSGRMYSFTDPADSLLTRVCVGKISSFPSADWAYSSDDDQRRRCVWLLKAALDEQMRPVLRASKELTWVAAPDELPLVIAIPGTSNTRALVKAYFRDDGSTRYVRHLAFSPAFVCYADQWYLELTPTYHFTRDGREASFNAASHRSGIKRRERHSDFRRNVDTLARVLRGDVDLGGLAPDPDHQLLEFGALAQVRLDTGGDDQYEVDDNVGVDDEEDESGDRSAA